MNISIIIVNYNTQELLDNCLESIIKYTSGIEYEIIVADNASVDGSKEMLKKKYQQVILVENSANLGFGKANNIGAKFAIGKYLFLLNSDCLLIENTLKMFFEFMEKNNKDETIGVLGGLLYDPEMNLNISYHKFPAVSTVFKSLSNPLFNKFFPNFLDHSSTHNYEHSSEINEVEFITGADMFMLKQTFEKMNGFDEQFFLYYEESDLQKRMENEGLKRIILKDQKIIHLEGYSSKKASTSLKKTLIMRDSMYKYFRKHLSFFSFSIFYLLVTPLQIKPLFNNTYTFNEKKEWLKMLMRKDI